MSSIADLLGLVLKVVFSILFEVLRILVVSVVWLFGLGATYLDRRRQNNATEGRRR